MLLVLLALSPVGSAAAKSAAEIQEDIEMVLKQRHPTDTGDWWKGLGPNAPSVIMKMYEDSEHIYHRIRLLQGLGWFDDPASVEFIKQQAQSTPDDVIRNAAIKSVGISQGAKEEEFIAKFLKHSDPQTRLAAAETLKRINDAQARAILEKYMAEEKAQWILQRLRNERSTPRALVPVTSSEDRLSPDFAGTWEGFWVAPVVDSLKALESDPAVLRLKVENATTVSGELSLKVAQPQGSSVRTRSRTLKVTAKGKAAHFSGILVEQESPSVAASARPGGAADGAPEATPRAHREVRTREYSFEADLVHRAGALMLEVRSPAIGATLIVRREQ